MKLTITIEMDNAAFHAEDCPDPSSWSCCYWTRAAELARILRHLAERQLAYADAGCPAGQNELEVLDVNGNRVGSVELS